jgi:hypothetical protein
MSAQINDPSDEFEVNVLESGQISETMFEKLVEETKNSKDAELQQLHRVVMDGWPQTKPINGLLDEGRAIQKRLVRQSKQRSSDDTARVFAKLMMQGKVRAAIRIISEDNGGCLTLDSCVAPGNPKTVRQVLLEKHPPNVLCIKCLKIRMRMVLFLWMLPMLLTAYTVKLP